VRFAGYLGASWGWRHEGAGVARGRDGSAMPGPCRRRAQPCVKACPGRRPAAWLMPMRSWDMDRV